MLSTARSEPKRALIIDPTAHAAQNAPTQATHTTHATQQSLAEAVVSVGVAAMIVLVLGGTRSGKSSVGTQIAADLAAGDLGEQVTFLAPAMVDSGDSNYAARVAAHQASRPSHWRTLECRTPGDLPDLLVSCPGVVLLDSLGTWVASHALVDTSSGVQAGFDAKAQLDVHFGLLVKSLKERSQATVIVSEEVGMSVHAQTELGRRYTDAVGTLNQQVAALAHKVLFVMAGRVLELPTSYQATRAST